MHDDGGVNNDFCPNCCTNLAGASIIIKSGMYGDQVCAASIAVGDCTQSGQWETFECPGDGLIGETIEVKMADTNK